MKLPPDTIFGCANLIPSSLSFHSLHIGGGDVPPSVLHRFTTTGPTEHLRQLMGNRFQGLDP